MTWVKLAPGVEVAYAGSVIYLMTKSRAGRPNRWDIINVATRFAGAAYLGRELPPGHCRRLARQDAGIR